MDGRGLVTPIGFVGRIPRSYLAVVGLVTIAEAVDTYLDFRAEGLSPSVLLDLSMVVLVGGGLLYITRSLTSLLLAARSESAKAHADLQTFRARNEDIIFAMRDAIHAQLQTWGLSRAEKRVAEFLIRGYPTRRIAAMLDRSERTIRNQAISVYRKAGMTSRGDLAAFFLQEILGDEDEAAGSPGFIKPARKDLRS